jgi:hypothetical protein
MTAAGAPDAPGPPEVYCKSPHVAVVSWSEPPCNGSAVTDYHLEWQMKDEPDFMPVCSCCMPGCFFVDFFSRFEQPVIRL